MMSFYLILFFYFAGLGANLSSLSPYLISYFGKNSEWIFVSIQLMVPLGTLFAGWISDKTKKIRVFLYYSLFFTIPAQYFLFSFPENWVYTLFFAAILRFILSANYQWIAIAVLEKIGEHEFSKVRSSGTLGFLLVQLLLYALTSPLMEVFNSPELTGRFGSIFYILPLLLNHKVPENRTSEQEFRFKDAIQLIQKKEILYFFILSFFYYAGYQVTDNYQGRYFQISFGLDSVYLSWVFAVILEVPFLLLITRIVHKFNFFILFYLSIIAGIVRFGFLSYSVIGTSIYEVLIFQLPHAILFAGYYMGGLHFLRKLVPNHLFGSVYGLFSIFTMSLGGMVGNIISSNLLHSNFGIILVNYISIKDIIPGKVEFLPVFIFTTFIFISIFPFFIKLNKMIITQKK